MSNRFLVEQFHAWQSQGEPLVLVTVIETAGSTYSKAGRQLLINPECRYAGLVGGGCLEGDLLARADQVFDDGAPIQVTYDMREDDDDLWGMGLGCRGMMRLLLQRLDSGNDWEPFATLAGLMSGAEPVRVRLSLNGADTGTLSTPDEPVDAMPQLSDDGEALLWTIRPWIRLLVLGGGPDAVPVCDMAAGLGWQVTVADHRQAYLDAGEFDNASRCVCVTPATLADDLDLSGYDAVCVMSHHLRSDAAYLRALSNYPFAYAGVLGPAARKASLLEELKLVDTSFGKQLRGPVGIDIGADTPQTIALALLAEIQETLAR